MVRVPLREARTLHHDGNGRQGAGKVMVRSAPPGTGVIAGGADARGSRNPGRPGRRGQVARFLQPLQHGARHVRRAEGPVVAPPVAAKRGKKVGEIVLAARRRVDAERCRPKANVREC